MELAQELSEFSQQNLENNPSDLNEVASNNNERARSIGNHLIDEPESSKEELLVNNEDCEIIYENSNAVPSDLQSRINYLKIFAEIVNKYGNTQNFPDEPLEIQNNQQANPNNSEIETNKLET
jgi:hypothetical protein